MTETKTDLGIIPTLRTYSVPLLLGVVVAVVAANVMGGDNYDHIWHGIELGRFNLFGARPIVMNLHWIVNDVLMVFFFGVAAKEIVEAMLPGGDLNPPRKAINPIMGAIGGVVGPILVYLVVARLFYEGDAYSDAAVGFGIPTATDIALAWLVARLVFGKSHPAVNFLLLLAIADDGMGLGIIAIFYPDPVNPVAPVWLLLTAVGMAIAWSLRRAKVNHWALYTFVPGLLSWLGLAAAGIEPALALVFVLPFMPFHYVGNRAGEKGGPAADFEHVIGLPVDLVILLLFGLANAGVEVSAASPITVVVLVALVLGKTIGVSVASIGANAFGFPYPAGMNWRHIVAAGVTASVGLTVALFVAGRAYDGDLIHMQAPAKLGALLSAGGAILAMIVGKALRVKDQPDA